ncbi:hypothetical protein FRC09_009580 [Ceratobasidium sp. 395]|nr:hypothetical protein FRC09_009580 [Ceratobasidium sp. 395]
MEIRKYRGDIPDRQYISVYRIEKLVTDNKFWHNLDKTLGEMEEALADQEPDLTARAALRELVFEHALETHRNQFPTKVSAREAPYDAPSWQVTLEAQLARGLGFSASN